jgi:hypothetical protein
VIRGPRFPVLVALLAGAAGCSKGGPCETAVPPPDMSTSVEVDPSLACAIAVQRELAGGLTWTTSPAASTGAGAPTANGDGGSGPFAISQNGFTANTDCTTACSFNYNECFLPNDYLEAYVGAESTADGAGPGAQGHAIGTASDGGSACPDVASVTVTCTYTSAGFCE